ncbi:immunity repressor [Gordonia phage RayTheFireFly]|nr:immunity repressor [Gordonia phage RayTheFireFly]
MTTASIHELRASEPRSQQIARRLRGFLAEEQVPAIRLAQELGLTQSKLARRMTGNVAFSIDELDTISRVLGIRFEWLTTGVGPAFDPEGGTSLSPLTGSNRRPLAYKVGSQPARLYPFRTVDADAA